MRLISVKEKNTNIFMGISEAKRLFKSHRFKRGYNIKMYIKELGCEGVSWVRMNQDRKNR
jgi:hypothetical protein